MSINSSPWCKSCFGQRCIFIESKCEDITPAAYRQFSKPSCNWRRILRAIPLTKRILLTIIHIQQLHPILHNIFGRHIPGRHNRLNRPRFLLLYQKIPMLNKRMCNIKRNFPLHPYTNIMPRHSWNHRPVQIVIKPAVHP